MARRDRNPGKARTRTPKRSADKRIMDELTRLAEIAAGVVDGEDAKAIITPLAMKYIANPDPEHVFLSGDYYDVDHERFLRVKKLLLRIERLAAIPMSCSLWAPIPGRREATCAVQNGAYARYYTFGQERLKLPPEMAKALSKRNGRVTPAPVLPDGPGAAFRTVLAPVRDSLGDVVAVVELTAPVQLPAPAWS